MGGKYILSWIPNFKRDVICFSWLYVGERSVTQARAAAGRRGHTGNVCSLRLGRPVDRTPGIPENKTADVQAGIVAFPRMMMDLGRVRCCMFAVMFRGGGGGGGRQQRCKNNKIP